MEATNKPVSNINALNEELAELEQQIGLATHNKDLVANAIKACDGQFALHCAKYDMLLAHYKYEKLLDPLSDALEKSKQETERWFASIKYVYEQKKEELQSNMDMSMSLFMSYTDKLSILKEKLEEAKKPQTQTPGLDITAEINRRKYNMFKQLADHELVIVRVRLGKMMDFMSAEDLLTGLFIELQEIVGLEFQARNP